MEKLGWPAALCLAGIIFVMLAFVVGVLKDYKHNEQFNNIAGIFFGSAILLLLGSFLGRNVPAWCLLGYSVLSFMFAFGHAYGPRSGFFYPPEELKIVSSWGVSGVACSIVAFYLFTTPHMGKWFIDTVYEIGGWIFLIITPITYTWRFGDLKRREYLQDISIYSLILAIIMLFFGHIVFRT